MSEKQHPGGYTYWTGRYGVAHSYDATRSTDLVRRRPRPACERQWWEK